MNRIKLERDGDRVKAHLRELPDESLVAVKAIKLIIPARYAEHSLAEVGIETYICGIVMYVVEDKYYALSKINAMIRITPTTTSKRTVDDEEFYEFYFEPGSVVTPSLNLVRTDTLVYKIFDELFAKGRVPSYMGYNDMAGIFDSARKHANANVGSNHEVTEMLVSLIARNPDDRTQYYRQCVTSEEDLVKRPPIWTSLYSVTDAATNTLNKLAGSYFHEGVVSALNSPAERTERLEDLLRA
jgi:hypothetical protein